MSTGLLSTLLHGGSAHTIHATSLTRERTHSGRTGKPEIIHKGEAAARGVWIVYETRRAADDLEFYHDKSGLSSGRQGLVEGVKNNICGKVTRELVPLPTCGQGDYRFDPMISISTGGSIR